MNQFTGISNEADCTHLNKPGFMLTKLDVKVDIKFLVSGNGTSHYEGGNPTYELLLAIVIILFDVLSLRTSNQPSNLQRDVLMVSTIVT